MDTPIVAKGPKRRKTGKICPKLHWFSESLILTEPRAINRRIVPQSKDIRSQNSYTSYMLGDIHEWET